MHFALSILRLSSGINILKYELVKSDLGNRPWKIEPANSNQHGCSSLWPDMRNHETEQWLFLLMKYGLVVKVIMWK